MSVESEHSCPNHSYNEPAAARALDGLGPLRSDERLPARGRALERDGLLDGAAVQAGRFSTRDLTYFLWVERATAGVRGFETDPAMVAAVEATGQAINFNQKAYGSSESRNSIKSFMRLGYWPSRFLLMRREDPSVKPLNNDHTASISLGIGIKLGFSQAHR